MSDLAGNGGHWCRKVVPSWILIPLRLSIHRAQSIYQPLRRFFRDILHTKYRAATDVYVLMFLADIVDFIIIIFGFWAFGVSGHGTLEWKAGF